MTGGGADGSVGGDPTARYFPMDVGAEWTYRVVDGDSGAVTSKTQSVEAYEDVGGRMSGVMAFRLVTTKPNGQTMSWQEDTGDSIVRHREQGIDSVGTVYTDEWYMPGKLRIDESHLEVGAVYEQTYTQETIDMETAMTMEISKTETWTVEAIDEVIEVPAGTFTALRLYRTGETTNGVGAEKRYWFARGVGKIKEEGEGQTEELHSFTLP